MKTLTDSFFKRKKKQSQRPMAFNKHQTWDYWCAEIIINLLHGFKEYKDKHPDYDPRKNDYPVDFADEVRKFADDKEELWDTIHCLYECWYNGDFDLDDVSKAGYTKVKFYGT